MEMAKTDAAFSTENVEEGRFSEDAQSLESHEKGNSRTMRWNQASLESEWPKEYFVETDNLFRTALMDCYNR
jgi:hypothetical protein